MLEQIQAISYTDFHTRKLGEITVFFALSTVISGACNPESRSERYSTGCKSFEENKWSHESGVIVEKCVTQTT